jgi:hypothetical protein
MGLLYLFECLSACLPNNTQQSQETDIHAPGGIRTNILSKQAAAESRLRPRGYWDRLTEKDYHV